MTGQVVSSDLPVKWRQEFERYAKDQCNLLVPREIGEVPPFYTPRMAVVAVNPDKDAGDVYPLPGSKWGLSKVALDRIAQAGAISWLPELCGRVDDGSNPRKFAYRAVGKVKGLDGAWKTIIGTKEIDLDVIEEELRASVPRREKCPQKEPERSRWIDATVRDESIQFRKHLAARAESGAKNRAIRSAFALRSSYAREELSRPFVIPRVSFTPDYNDPETKRFLLAEATGSLRELYGESVLPTGQIPPALPPAPDEPDPDPIAGESAPTEPPPPASGTTEQPPPQTPHYGDPTPAPDSDEVRFQEAAGDAKKEQEALLRLIGRKGYDTGRMKKPLDKFDKGERLGFLKHLLNMADVKPPELPWS